MDIPQHQGNPDILDAIADASEQFQLSPPPAPSAAEIEVAAKVLSRIMEQNRRRASRHSKEGILVCFTYKLPAHELQAMREACDKHEITYTDIPRFASQLLVPLLQSPTEEIRPLLETIRQEVLARRDKAIARENARRNPALSTPAHPDALVRAS